MSVSRYEFNRENLDYFLKELAKEVRKEFGRNKVIEIILVGGAAIITQYSFRLMSTDIDADIPVDMRSIINRMADRFNLPREWLNTDFKKTASYSPRLRLYSKPYRTYSNILEVRLVKDEYLIAMKLKSARQYKRDLSDIVGIVKEMREKGRNINYEMVDRAMCNLYGSWDGVPEYGTNILNICLSSQKLDEVYKKCLADEDNAKDELINIEQRYPGAITADNANMVIEKRREDKESFLKKVEKTIGRE